MAEETDTDDTTASKDGGWTKAEIRFLIFAALAVAGAIVYYSSYSYSEHRVHETNYVRPYLYQLG